ncbi:hypothetical protein [uncultured Enterovirga sp.]|uniref:hypothetical protein n=1 Tax=uncultured Enterovirga sp. TaxID=2026352 RepID=UPI0035CC1E20
MRKTILSCGAALALMSFAGAGVAQNAAPATPGANTGRPSSGTATGSSNPAANPGGNAPSSVNATGKATIVPLTSLENGSNSFTEGQARSRLEAAGFTNVTELKKDDQGIWRGKAMRDGKSVTVGFDYKGNIGA